MTLTSSKVSSAKGIRVRSTVRISIFGAARRMASRHAKYGASVGLDGSSRSCRKKLFRQRAPKRSDTTTRGDKRARLAIDAFVESVRHYVGAYLVALGGCDVLAFTGGIGENGIDLRGAICHNLEWAGIVLDPAKNQVRGTETKISKVESRAEIWIVPTNEELIVARQTESVLNAN